MKTKKGKITEKMWSKEIEDELERKVACGLLKKSKMKGLWAYQNANPIMDKRLNREVIWDISQKSFEAGKSEAIKQVLEILRKGFIRNRDFIKIEAEIGDLAK